MIPKMNFGQTGHQSTRILFGAAALGSVTQKEADQTLELLLKWGVNHIDTAASYGEAEDRIGPWMKAGYRQNFFLATKTGEREYQKAKDEIHKSLERMHVDQIDLIQLHAVTTFEELEAVMGPGGGLEAALEAREQGLVRFIGITSHTLLAPSVHLRALERFPFTSVLLPLNYPMYDNPQYRADFDALAAVCKERNVAMQTIKAVCRRPWPEGAERYAASWYEPLVETPAVQKAVHWVFGHPAQVFLNTVADIHQLPGVLEAAGSFSGSAPDEDSMRAMVQEYQMIPLWPEHEGAH